MAVNQYVADTERWEPARLKLVFLSVIGGMLLAAVIALYIWFQDEANFPVRQLQLEGAFERVSVEELREEALPMVAGGFFHLDIASLLSRVESLPWVWQAEVERVWPDSIKIAVQEQQPVARWGDEKNEMVNKQGEIFVVDRQAADIHLSMVGPQGSEGKVVKMYGEMQAYLQPLGLTVVEIVVDERRSWNLRLSNGIQVMLGRDFVLDRLDRFLTVYPVMERANLPQIERVDLRYTNGFSVKMKEQARPRIG